MAGVRERLGYARQARRERPFWTVWLLGFFVFAVANGLRDLWIGDPLMALLQVVVAAALGFVLAMHFDQPRQKAIEAAKEAAKANHWAEWHLRAEALDEQFFGPQGWRLYSGSPGRHYDHYSSYYVALYPPDPRWLSPDHVFQASTRDARLADMALVECLRLVMAGD